MTPLHEDLIAATALLAQLAEHDLDASILVMIAKQHARVSTLIGRLAMQYYWQA